MPGQSPEAAHRRSGPIRVMVREGDQCLALLEPQGSAEMLHRIDGVGGDRFVRIPRHPPDGSFEVRRVLGTIVQIHMERPSKGPSPFFGTLVGSPMPEEESSEGRPWQTCKRWGLDDSMIPGRVEQASDQLMVNLVASFTNPLVAEQSVVALVLEQDCGDGEIQLSARKLRCRHAQELIGDSGGRLHWNHVTVFSFEQVKPSYPKYLQSVWQVARVSIRATGAPPRFRALPVSPTTAAGAAR